MSGHQAGSGPWAALHDLRIGCVQYLNSRPLIHGYDQSVRLAHPSELADELSGGALDVGLVPMFEVLRDPIYTIVDDVAIASDGAVYSVFLAHRKPLAEVRTVALDPASRTSVHLLQVLLAEYHGIRPECRHPRTFTAPADAELLIGNQAIEGRTRPGMDLEILDLGEEWKRCTGLPFVYAAWAVRPEVMDAEIAGQAFRALKEHGLQHIDEIVASDKIATPEIRQKYLREYIRFNLRDGEKAGIALYRKLLEKYGFIRPSGTRIEFV